MREKRDSTLDPPEGVQKEDYQSFYDNFGYFENLEVKYEGIKLLSQYKLSYTREFRSEIFEIQQAINNVYQVEFHKKQFFLTLWFALIYIVCLFIGFYVITRFTPESKKEESEELNQSLEDEDKIEEGGEKDDNFKKI